MKKEEAATKIDAVDMTERDVEGTKTGEEATKTEGVVSMETDVEVTVKVVAASEEVEAVATVLSKTKSGMPKPLELCLRTSSSTTKRVRTSNVVKRAIAAESTSKIMISRQWTSRSPMSNTQACSTSSSRVPRKTDSKA